MKIEKNIKHDRLTTKTEYTTCVCDAKADLVRIKEDAGGGYWLTFNKQGGGKSYELLLHANKGMLQAIAVLVMSEFGTFSEGMDYQGGKYLARNPDCGQAPAEWNGPDDYNMA